MSKPRVSKRMAETVAYLTGNVKEPTFNALNSERIDLVNAFNYYSQFAKKDMSKKWALIWVKANMSKELHDMLKAKKDWKFENRGFFCRMFERGYVPCEKEMEAHKKFFTTLAFEVEAVEVSEDAPVVKKVKVEPVNKALESFDYALDAVVKNKNPILELGANKKEFAEVEVACNELLKDVEENAEGYDARVVTRIKRFVKTVKGQLETVVVAVRKQTARKAAPKNVSPVKMVAGLPFNKDNVELGLAGMRPEKLVGAKQVIVYNAKYRFLMYFKALTDDGFTVSGASLKNYDPSKSYFKKVRKPSDMAVAIKNESLAGMKRFLDAMTGKAFESKSRFNDECIILKV